MTLGILVLFAASRFLYVHTNILEMDICGFRMMTGLDCPGCGMTHAMVELSMGNFRESVKCNPMAPIFLLLILFFYLRSLYLVFFEEGKRRVSGHFGTWVAVIVLAGFLIGWIARMFIRMVY